MVFHAVHTLLAKQITQRRALNTSFGQRQNDHPPCTRFIDDSKRIEQTRFPFEARAHKIHTGLIRLRTNKADFDNRFKTRKEIAIECPRSVCRLIYAHRPIRS